MRDTTVVQQLCKSCRACFMFYCMFYFTCDRSFTHLDVLGHDVEVELVEEKSASHGAGMEAHRALAVVSQPDVRIRRLLPVIPGHFQASPGGIQVSLCDGHRRQARMVVGRRLAEQQSITTILHSAESPTQLRCQVESRRRCKQNSQQAHDDCRRIRSTIWKLTKQDSIAV